MVKVIKRKLPLLVLTAGVESVFICKSGLFHFKLVIFKFPFEWAEIWNDFDLYLAFEIFCYTPCIAAGTASAVFEITGLQNSSVLIQNLEFRCWGAFSITCCSGANPVVEFICYT